MCMKLRASNDTLLTGANAKGLPVPDLELIGFSFPSGLPSFIDPSSGASFRMWQDLEQLAVVPRPLSYRCLKSFGILFAPRHVNQLAFDIREPRARACERGEDRKTGQEQLVVDGWLCSRCAGT